MQEQLSSCNPSTIHASDTSAIRFVEIGVTGIHCIIARRSCLEAAALRLLRVRAPSSIVPIYLSSCLRWPERCCQPLDGRIS